MKKLMIAAVAAISLAVTAQATTFWSSWNSSEVKDRDLGKATVLGLSSDVKSMSGAQVDVCVSKAEEFKSGCQFAFGYSRVVTLRNGCQVAFWNNAKG